MEYLPLSLILELIVVVLCSLASGYAGGIVATRVLTARISSLEFLCNVLEQNLISEVKRRAALSARKSDPADELLKKIAENKPEPQNKFWWEELTPSKNGNG